MTGDKKPCYCGSQMVEPADAAIELNGTPICNLKCLKRAEEERLREKAAAAGRIS